MNIHCESFVLCERVIEDAATRTLTLVGCLEQITAVVFPAKHPGFACAARFVWNGEPPAHPILVQYRLVRCSEHEADEVVSELTGEWTAGASSARVVISFRLLRLKRPERLRFRMEHRLNESAWIRSAEYSIDILKAQLTREERDALKSELEAHGLPTADLDAD